MKKRERTPLAYLAIEGNTDIVLPLLMGRYSSLVEQGAEEATEPCAIT